VQNEISLTTQIDLKFLGCNGLLLKSAGFTPLKARVPGIFLVVTLQHRPICGVEIEDVLQIDRDHGILSLFLQSKGKGVKGAESKNHETERNER